MSLFDYEVGRMIASEYSFYAIIQAAMRQADTENLEKLRMAWPDIWQELLERWNAPDGKLSGDE